MISLIIALICALLGSIGGNGYLWARRFVLPVFITVIAYFFTKSLYSLTFLLLIPCLLEGYGTKSAIYKFWLNKYPLNLDLSSVLTRGTVGLAISLSLGFYAYFCSIVGVWVWLSIGIILSNIIIGAVINPQGTVKFFKMNLLWSELWLYFFDGLLISWLIL